MSNPIAMAILFTPSHRQKGHILNLKTYCRYMTLGIRRLPYQWASPSINNVDVEFSAIICSPVLCCKQYAEHRSSVLNNKQSLKYLINNSKGF
jgi:hypothetical protein